MKQVEIFIENEKIIKPGCACRPGSDPTDEDMTFVSSLINDFLTNYPAVAKFSVVNKQNINEAEFVYKINKLFSENGENLTLSADNASFLLPRLLPILTVNGKILSINKLPLEDELYEVISTESRVFKKSGCC